MAGEMTPAERTAAALRFEEPDRVPLFLFFTMYGAKELGLSIREYFSRPEYVAAGQLRLLKKFGGDCVTSFCYAASEVEAWGGEVIFRDDGPPNAGRPPIREADEIEALEVPTVEESPSLLFGLRTIELLKREVGDDVPIIGSVVSPFSLPVIQMGFDAYIDLLYGEPDLFWKLMAKNEEFCVRWANAQFEAGATAVTYADPLASTDMTPLDLYRRTGLVVAKRTIPRIRGDVATGLASARALPVIDDLAGTGSVGVGVSTFDDLAALKRQSAGRLAVIGNLNAIEMCRWTPARAETEVKRAIAAAGPGGGFILSDNHGEIPWQVPGSVLLAISAAVRKWGAYPLEEASL
ncbi:methylcobamide--CoM methyltransferase MtbA [Methanoculleus sp. Wushi-C6]|uniref:Methylcobamide--CoM methyltransferase MtbA n=1 Tax=Methanoculleus caldifontis TaxID=2651577 RepID=A0ABU3X3B9_9EURY|nr:uroporphyrinogen decarboxylase family protein [Methanoculleus sp. Wushi-C6]MDV2482529.1 methylcobamide--CoM methyltransferase MtbA [Methanoculleus sp. Wushi-C6]